MPGCGTLWSTVPNIIKSRADDLHERERVIKAERGIIYDRNGVALATNQSVCTISVIHNQITDPEQVIQVLSETLELDEEKVRKRVEKVSSIEKIRSNVPKETGDLIRSYKLDGVMEVEDYSRYYPFDALAAKTIGFTRVGIIRESLAWKSCTMIICRVMRDVF